MSKYRNHLPQLDGRMFLTDGGLETTLVFHDGIDLPYFAAFDVLRDQQGVRRQPSEFLLDGSGKILTSSYSSGPLGRMDAEDVIKMVGFMEKRKAAG